MKKLLILTPAVLLLAACATSAPINTDKKVESTYSCEDNGKVTATYATDGSAADLNITLPKVGLNNQKVIVTQAVSGSGTRYTNMSNPKLGFEWQTKADYGVMTVHSSNGQNYSVNCTI